MESEKWLQRGRLLKFFYIIRPRFKLGQGRFSTFGRESPKDHFCEVSIESDIWLQRSRL